MTKDYKQGRKSLVFATVVGGAVMLITGIAYRVMAARLDAPVGVALLSQEELARLPLQLGGWTGREQPLDEAVVEATDTDAYVSRRYSRGPDSVWLYIAYGVNARDLAPHRPEVCYTGAGWTLIDRRTAELDLSDGAKLPCNVMQFSRGTLNKQRVVVLDYYIVDGQHSHDVSLLRSKAWRGSGTVGHVVQVQIVVSIAPNLSSDSAGRSVYDFAAESALSIADLFEGAERDGEDGKIRR